MLSNGTIDRYLHAVLYLGDRFPVVRAVDVAAYLEYSKASVSVAIKQMLQEELLTVGQHGALTLTPGGSRRANAFHERFAFFYQLLTEAGIDEGTAQREARAIAGSLSASSLKALRQRLRGLSADPEA